MKNFSTDMNSTERAILLTTANKYDPGIQKFRLQTLIGLKDNSSAITTTNISIPNMMNKDTDIGLTSITECNYIELELPQEVARNYPLKFIPPGTVFIVSFNSGDITKPVIVGGDWK